METVDLNFSTVECVYFLGIGGIGMSALARYFMHYGKVVAGYDQTETPLTRQHTLSGRSYPDTFAVPALR